MNFGRNIRQKKHKKSNEHLKSVGHTVKLGSKKYLSFFLESYVGGQGHRKFGHLCLVFVRPDRQTWDSFYRKSGQNPDIGQNRDRK